MKVQMKGWRRGEGGVDKLDTKRAFLPDTDISSELKYKRTEETEEDHQKGNGQNAKHEKTEGNSEHIFSIIPAMETLAFYSCCSNFTQDVAACGCSTHYSRRHGCSQVFDR